MPQSAAPAFKLHSSFTSEVAARPVFPSNERVKRSHDIHLAYCTNIHRGETWAETLDSLERHALAVKEQVSPHAPYAIGLRLSDRASRELTEAGTLNEFRRWLDRHDCYVFTINGFPFGQFHGGRVKERVYLPDWTSRERLDYTKRLFDILAQILPPGIEGSVSTLPGSFKEFITTEEQVCAMRENLWHCVEHIATLSEKTGQRLHLGLEPEPLGFFETSRETADFLLGIREQYQDDPRLRAHLGVNYDACHLAVEFEEPQEAIRRFQESGIRISKIHLSSALKLRPTTAALEKLQAFADDTYLHQVIARAEDGTLVRVKDLPPALEPQAAVRHPQFTEWRVHFHIPLHCPAGELFDNTGDHILGVLDLLKTDPALCSHLEMETYTWEVLPGDLKKHSVVDQLVAEYRWTLDQLNRRGL
jgi:sugar phosphate isomerase/epimerase